MTFLIPTAFGENPPEAEKGSDTKGKQSESGGRAEKKSKPNGDVVGFSGLTLGSVDYVDPKLRFLYLKPFQEHAHRVTVYLDSKTLYRREKKRFPKEELTVGKRVGVRYLRLHGITVAEGVFILTEDFELRDLQMPRKAPPPKADGEKPAAGGEHGAAKPPPSAAKPKGGGHH